MELEERITKLETELTALKEQFTAVTAKQMATEQVVGMLLCFIEMNPLLAEVVLQKAADLEADAMQQDENTAELLPAFLAEIDSWHEKLLASENTLQSLGTKTGD